MNPPKCDELDYIQFLVAAQKAFTATEAARSQPESRQKPPAHDAFTRLLTRKPPNTEALWREAEALVKVGLGLLVHDDTTLDKPYARKMELVRRHWSGKHKKRVVSGINLSTLLWTDGHALVPTDFRVYDKPQDGLTKNEHFRRMLARAEARGFRPRYVLFDSWYSALKNLKAIRDYGWQWLTRLKSNRLVNPEKKGNLPVREVPIPTEGRVVHLKGYGMVKVFWTVAKDGDAEYWATNDLGMSEEGRRELKRQGWGIESYHRGIKQCCGVERSQASAHKHRAGGEHRGITWSLRCALSCAWRRIECERASAGTKPKAPLSGKRYALT